MSTFQKLSILVLACVITASPAAAQILYGSIVGTVEDPSGSVVPKAKVVITNTATSASREVEADDAGRYSFVNVAAGTYELKFTATGFRTLTRQDVEVSINNISRVDVRLEVGALTEQVTISAQAAALQTDKADTRTEITTTAVAQMPLPAYRNYQSLINLVPGATPAAFQNAAVDSPSRSLTTNVNGTNRNNNNTRVDGATNVFLWLPHHTLLNPPIESIETVNVTTSSFDAEQGLAGGAAVTVTTKSGTNDYHGSAFWYYDNQYLKARPYFYYPAKTASGGDGPLPFQANNIYGGTIGGRIIRNKLFWFFSYERTSEKSGQTYIGSLPNADMRTGDFSRYTGLSLIYDPATGATNGAGRTAFPENKIPANRISSIFNNIQKMAPLPNRAGNDIYSTTNNYQVGGTQNLGRHQYDTKVNWNPTQKLAIFGKYSRMDALVTGIGAFGELVGPGLGTLGTGDTEVQMPSGGYNYTWSPTFLMDGVFGYSQFDQTVTSPDYGKFWGSEIWGIPGTNGGTQYAKDILYSGMPCLTPYGDGWGNCNTWMPLQRNDKIYTFTANFTKIKGAHEIRWGFDMNRYAMNHWQPETANPRGNIAFSSVVTVPQGAVGQITNTYASALLGLAQNYGKSVQYLLMQTREWQWSFYARDRWQVNRKLVINYGLKYQYFPLINRGDRGLERWDPATNLVTMGGVGNIPFNNGITVSKTLFAPNLGIAYRADEKTVIRTGFGMNYDPLPFSRPLRGLYPATITATFQPTDQYAYYNNISVGIPPVPTPDISTGVIPLAANLDMGPRSPWAGELNRGYIASWNFTVERQLPRGYVASVAYVGNSTVHAMGDRDINWGTLGLGPAGRVLNATLGRQITTNMWDGFVSANYHSLQAQMNKSFSNGFLLKTSYTLSKAINVLDDDGWAGPPTWNTPAMAWRSQAPAGYDRRQLFSAGWVYELPFGKGRKYDMKGFADYAFGGWKLNGVFMTYTGTPFTVTASTASLNTPGDAQTAYQVGELRKIGNFGPGTSYFDPTSFADPNFGRPSNVFRYGTMGRNSVYGPGFWRTDLGVFKDFVITEKVRAEFKMEAFNFTNTPRFNNPNASVSSMTFNSDGSIRNQNNFMGITSAFDRNERQFRFGLKLSF